VKKLLLLYGPGLIGGLVIPVLGAVPDAAIVLVSGLGSDAQSQVSIGVGTLAGSTIMLLTIPWALAVFLGSRDYDETTKKAASNENTRKAKCENGLTLFKSCITTYPNIPFGAKLMMTVATSYLIVAIPAAINKRSVNAAKDEQKPALVGLIVCAIAFVAYSAYQVTGSRSQKLIEMRQRREEFDRWKRYIGRHFGQTDRAIRTVFDKFDKDKNGKIDRNELYTGFQAMGLNCSREQVYQIMKDMNTDDDIDTLSFDEFAVAIKKWSPSILYQQKTTNMVELQQQKSTKIKNKDAEEEEEEEENQDKNKNKDKKNKQK